MLLWHPWQRGNTRVSRRQLGVGGAAAVGLFLVAPFAAIAATRTFRPWWVQNFQVTHLWSGPDSSAVDYGLIPRWSYLDVVAPQRGARLFVYVPWTKNVAYVDAAAVGPSGPPPPGWMPVFVTPAPAAPVPTTASQPSPPPSTDPAPSWAWLGRVIDREDLWERSAPTQSAPVVKRLPYGTIVYVTAWVNGQEIVKGNWTWGNLADGNFFYSNSVQIVPPTTPPPPPANHPSGKWIDVNTLREVVVAYQDDTPMHLAIISSGSPGWETPVGVHYIARRLPNETMRSSTLTSLGLDALQLGQANYDLKNVLYTQYFDGFGDALHDNYWTPSWQFGVPHSHGCVGMQAADALWFWNWATEGTPVVVHRG
ncbi:MAG TPA: L,D-transpeptidase family protein [Chloroflexota bacterium]|nr:L,D-transpeptidase family protein [Chloroflexota bacterium]